MSPPLGSAPVADTPAPQLSVLTLPAQSSTPPSKRIGDRQVSVSGRFPSVAAFADEEWNELPAINDARAFAAALSEARLGTDLFTFAEPLGCTKPRFAYFRMEWDNAAAVPLTSFKEWWEKRLPQESRKNVRRSERRGVTVREVTFADSLVEGIKRIYDETPIRQGRRFWHFGKDLPTIKRENSSYLERSDWFGAYFQEQLIGFMKVVYVGHIARIMQILSMNAHFDKRPSNALLAKAVERSCERGMQYFVYGKYVYGNKRNSPVTEFKRRTGFEELRFPRYYIPLSFLGKASLGIGLHLGIRNLLPEPVTEFLLKTRTRLLTRIMAKVSHRGASSEGE